MPYGNILLMEVFEYRMWFPAGGVAFGASLCHYLFQWTRVYSVIYFLKQQRCLTARGVTQFATAAATADVCADVCAQCRPPRS